MIPQFRYAIIGGTLAAGRRVLIMSAEHGGFRQVWQTARRDLFVKSARDGAIGSGAGLAVGHLVDMRNRNLFKQVWRQLTSNIPEGQMLEKAGKFEPLPDSVMFSPSNAENWDLGGLSGQFSVRPLHRAWIPERFRRFRFGFTPKNVTDLPLFQQSAGTVDIPWPDIPTEVQQQLRRHDFTVIPPFIRPEKQY
jgi:hypothetical protein